MTRAGRPPRELPASELIGRRLTIEVPATTANLGAGFDALALALDLANTIELEGVDGRGWELTVEGEGSGAEELAPGRRNRFMAAFARGLRAAGRGVPSAVGWRVHMRNEVPLGRGLGSSAAATVGGLVAARALSALSGGTLGQQALLRLATEMEGHPDNAAAALLGGFVVVTLVDGVPQVVRFDPPAGLLAVLFIPERRLATRDMRAVLPAQVPRADAVFNVGRAALAVAALASGRLDMLRAGTEDRLHEPYRAAIYLELARLVAAAREAGALGACLSGAGSTVIAFTDSEARAEEVAAAMASEASNLKLDGRAARVRPRSAGAILRDERLTREP